MMEEVSDDTNGESSFEFVGGKVDEVLKEETASVSQPEQYYIPTSVPLDDSRNFPVSVPNLASTLPVMMQNTQSNITFYNIDPKDTKSFMLPPLIPPTESQPVMPSMKTSPPSGYLPMQQSYSSMTIPTQSSTTPQAPPIYRAPQCEQVLMLPLESSDTMPLQQQPTEAGVWGWLKGKDFLNKVAEKAKNSVDSVITTLDPGMKEIINTGGDINVIVASSNEDKISAVREAFQLVFGKATVQGIAVQSSSIAPQPVGFSAGLKAAEERINNLKQMGFAQDKQILLSIENFLAELTPENWFDMGCLLLQDQNSGISLQVYTEAIPVSSQYVAMAKDQTPSNYPLGWSGYAVTIGQIMGPALGVHYSLWHQALTGVSRRDILLVAAKTIAGLYRFHVRR